MLSQTLLHLTAFYSFFLVVLALSAVDLPSKLPKFFSLLTLHLFILHLFSKAFKPSRSLLSTMKFNLCTVAMAAMILGVAARPSAEGVKAPAVIRHVRGGVVGELFGRDHDDDDDDDDDSSESSSSDTGYARASATGSGGASTTGSATSGSSGSSSGSLPASSGTSALSAVKTIAAGESFDGGMVMFDRGVSCTGQEEGGDSDAVFQLEDGASISNVIIGPNQIEGIHCQGACSLTNVCKLPFTFLLCHTQDNRKIARSASIFFCCVVCNIVRAIH